MKNVVFYIRDFLIIALISIYPILFLYFNNADFVFEGEVLTPILIVISASFTFLILFNLIHKKKSNNVLVVVILMLWFLLYGHVYFFLLQAFDLTYDTFRHRIFLLLYSLVFLIPIVVIWRREEVNASFMNLVFLLALGLNFQFIFKSMSGLNISADKSKSKKEVVQESANYPDVYYIIMDSHPNTKNLKKYFSYDNSKFTQELNEIGFQVIDNARSNYPFTYFSLPSSLNMEYINYFQDTVSKEKENGEYPYSKIVKNKVVDYFKNKGYKYVLYPSAYDQFNEGSEAEVVMSRPTRINTFHEALIQLSLLNCLNLEFHQQDLFDFYNGTFAMLPNTPKIKGSKFVFYHCLPPHPPMVFNAKGEFIYHEQNVENRYHQKKEYAEQVEFIDAKMLEIVKGILANSEQEPIIILQGDHGSASTQKFEDENNWSDTPTKEFIEERYGILNAIYLPKKYQLTFPKDHTPVNTFRRIVNTVFEDTLKILPNHYYYSNYSPDYHFKEVNP